VVEECERNQCRGVFAAYPHAVEYARIIFTIPVASVFVESLFSVMYYIKGKHRARHSDEGVAATIHIKECDSVISNGSGPLPDSLLLNQERFLLHDMRDAGFHPPTLPDNPRPVRQRSGPEADWQLAVMGGKRGGQRGAIAGPHKHTTVLLTNS